MILEDQSALDSVGRLRVISRHSIIISIEPRSNELCFEKECSSMLDTQGRPRNHCTPFLQYACQPEFGLGIELASNRVGVSDGFGAAA